MFTIHENLKSIDVKYGCKFDIPNKSIVPIFTKTDSILKSIYISSPKLSLPWNKTYSNDELTFNIEFSNDNNRFVNKLKMFCIKIINSKLGASNEFDMDLNQIKIYQNNDAHTLRFFNVKQQDILSYDEFGERISITDINRDDIVKILFHLNAIVIKGEKIQMDMRLIQIMKLVPYTKVNKIMNLLTVPKQIIIANTHAPPPPPPPKKGTTALINNSSYKTQMISSLSMISRDDLLHAMSKLKKR
mgnify:CR=1 FL=1